jgi:hypothetical protein
LRTTTTHFVFRQHPKFVQRSRHEKYLLRLLNDAPDLQEKLAPLLKEVGGPDKRVKIMILTLGNIDIFLNFICSSLKAVSAHQEIRAA